MKVCRVKQNCIDDSKVVYNNDAKLLCAKSFIVLLHFKEAFHDSYAIVTDHILMEGWLCVH